ncbi:MAG: hypothetical protein A2Y25_02930 [Candidatus Melainabacteria bacterium GWF2_37_15]|nr:MAG: hypothetical protein A2Y25_02930 [Candidatus Melainabacteria bacterium GWF2_37_15]
MKKHPETLKKFGLKLKIERIKRGLSQEQLADLAGLDTTSISLLETAKQNAGLSTIKSLADALGMSMSELLDIENI